MVSSSARRRLGAGAAIFSLLVLLASGWRWWTFQYETFDLAFYVQALWLALRAQWHVSLLNVPLMGNHAEPIVFLALPLFALCPHPLLLVGLQTFALASMPFTGARIARRLGFSENAAILLGFVTLLAPATGFVALHEFHPEAFAAPLLLLLIEARLARRLGTFWLWFLAVLACKENLALLLVNFCLIHAFLDWKKNAAPAFVHQWRWNFAPLLVAGAWLLIYGRVLSPWLNGGNVDYLELYSHLGHSGGEIVAGFFTHPQKALGALGESLQKGNLLWGLLVPFLGLPLLRPRWMLIGAPVIFQHLLSWRASEWSIELHYAAPLIPLFWMGAVEALAWLRLEKNPGASWALLGACVLSQPWLGPVCALGQEIRSAPGKWAERQWKADVLSQIAEDASVTAPLPYLSHLSTRRTLFSLHHILKGLKTLSRVEYVPEACTQVLLADYADPFTFDARSGYYHPRMRMADGRIIASSDRLLSEYLQRVEWSQIACNSLCLYTQGRPAAAFPTSGEPVSIDGETRLLGVQMAALGGSGAWGLRLGWEIGGEREVLPWMMMCLQNSSQSYRIIKGPCAPSLAKGVSYERWKVIFPKSLKAGTYEISLVFFDHTSAAWQNAWPPANRKFVIHELGAGEVTIGAH